MIHEHAGASGRQLASPSISMLSGKYDGTFAEQVAVPAHNMLPLPEYLTFEEAACLPTAWLTAYRMLFAEAGVSAGDTILVQRRGWPLCGPDHAREGSRPARVGHQPE